MLDLRLLNATINESYNQSAVTIKSTDNFPSGQRATGERERPIEIFTFKETPHRKGAYKTLNQKHLW